MSNFFFTANFCVVILENLCLNSRGRGKGKVIDRSVLWGYMKTEPGITTLIHFKILCYSDWSHTISALCELWFVWIHNSATPGDRYILVGM